MFRGSFMAEFTLSKPISSGKKRDPSTPGNIAYALFVLLCFWAGAQLLNLLLHAPWDLRTFDAVPGCWSPTGRMGLAVGTLFGLVPFLIGCLIPGGVALFLRWHRYR